MGCNLPCAAEMPAWIEKEMRAIQHGTHHKALCIVMYDARATIDRLGVLPHTNQMAVCDLRADPILRYLYYNRVSFQEKRLKMPVLFNQVAFAYRSFENPTLAEVWLALTPEQSHAKLNNREAPSASQQAGMLMEIHRLLKEYRKEHQEELNALMTVKATYNVLRRILMGGLHFTNAGWVVRGQEASLPARIQRWIVRAICNPRICRHLIEKHDTKVILPTRSNRVLYSVK